MPVLDFCWMLSMFESVYFQLSTCQLGTMYTLAYMITDKNHHLASRFLLMDISKRNL